MDDFYWLWLNRDDDALREPLALRPVLDRLAHSFLPKPVVLETTGARDTTIDGWNDLKILKAVEKGKPSIGLKAPGLQSTFGLTPKRVSMTLMFGAEPSAEDVRALFVDLCEITSPSYARCALHNHARALHEAHYSVSPRTFYASGLFWLNFFGPEEEARQGGSALATNPHASVRRLPNGLLVEVGRSAHDGLTGAGEAQLRAATAAMPPLPPDSTSTESHPQGPTETGAETPRGPIEGAPGPAPIIQISGIRGFFDPDERGFWISKHVDPPRKLERPFLRSLAALPGKGSPSIERVHVLFSTEAAARLNKEALDSVGAGSWYVSTHDGKRRRA